MSIDQQFVEFVVKSLVSKPDEVKVERRIDEKGVLLELTVDPEDLGRVIGKRGATAQSIRTLLRALGTKNDARYNMKIVDNGVERPQREERSSEERSEAPVDEADGAAPSEEAPTEKPEAKNDDYEDAWTSSSTSSASDDDEVEEEATDTLAKTRQELADLDDLDV